MLLQNKQLSRLCLAVTSWRWYVCSISCGSGAVSLRVVVSGVNSSTMKWRVVCCIIVIYVRLGLLEC